MPKRSEQPLEERDYGHLYLILAGLLAFTTFWAIWDMIRARAPWQGYQIELNEMEYANVEKEIEAAQKEMIANHGQELQSLQQQLAEAEKTLTGPEQRELDKALKQAETHLEKAIQEYRFAKSEYDALWYQYKHAEHTGQENEMQRLRPKVDTLHAEVTALKTRWDDAESTVESIEAQMAQNRKTVDSLKTAIGEIKEPVTELKGRLGRISDRKVEIEQFVLADFVRGNFGNYLDQVDRCTSCHVNADKGGYEDYPTPYKTHPTRDILLKTHPISRFGCTPCHEGQGEALMLPHAHGNVPFWEHPLLKSEFVETGCNKCHGDEMKTEHAPRLTKAKRMVFDLGCYACHDINGYENMRKIGPPLNAITKKTTPGFIYNWVQDTKSFRKYSRMPNPLFTEEEARAVTAYLVDISKETDYVLPKAPAGGSAERGEELVESIGCKGCHVITEKDREIKKTDVTYDIAPELTKIGSKVNRDWLYAWIKNPKQYHPNTTMPRLRLTDQEALDITAYLMTHKDDALQTNALDGTNLSSPELVDEGKAIIRNFGCHGCHEIAGMEGEGKVSVSLNEFGGKTHDELFFGDALADGRVEAETWEDWTFGKMRNSRMYATEAVIQRMPNYQFNEEDAKTMTMLLHSWDGRRIGSSYIHDQGQISEALESGRRLVRQYNCTGCHIIEGEGGFIRPTVVEHFKKAGISASEALSYAPPDLIGEGRKVQPDWLFEFLKSPTIKIRPWLDVRMPTFGFTDREVNTLIAYFQALEGKNQPFQEIDLDLTNTEIQAAERLFAKDLLSCFSCHQVGDKKPEGSPADWAPDFLLAPKRLNPDWVYDWIANPQKLQPGTSMPAFYPDAAPPNVLGGDSDKQIEALRDYIMNIDKFASRL